MGIQNQALKCAKPGVEPGLRGIAQVSEPSLRGIAPGITPGSEPGLRGIALGITPGSEQGLLREKLHKTFTVDALVQFNHLMPPEVWRWRDELIGRHWSITKHLVRTYIHTARKSGYAAANHQLRNIEKQLETTCLSELRVRVTTGYADVSDDEIIDYARDNALTCYETYEREASNGFYEAVEAVQSLVESLKVSFPYKPSKKDNEEATRTKLAGAVARVSDERWWRRKLRKKLGKQVEQVLRQLGGVKRSSDVYLSDWSFKRWQQSAKRNRAILDRLEAVNENGEVCKLVDAVDASTSNPAHRRAELMLRMRGYEEVAESMSFTALFFTLTAPSKYHDRLHTGARNPNSADKTPIETMQYLNGVWSRIRAKWNRNGIRAFGFRVAEPHHDGTPHWHLMLFFSKEHAQLAKKIFKAEALKEDGNEAGAKERRVDCEEIDTTKGSATGYLAKYISKNIDGEGVHYDLEAEALTSDTSARTRAWASTWSIRQFQQIGSVSVTVWRELRRRRNPLDQWECQDAEAIRAAADEGNWGRFVELMGGATVARNDQSVRPQHLIKPTPNRYGEEAKRLLGVVMRGAGRFIRTREHVWTIRETPITKRLEAFEVEAQPPPLDLCQ